ncbi:hypothetical protein LS70_002305 [Helicobacter sp. MIT 11-5569]|uniref:hypothetical protein n=1 Tax=Helicobacter sp. MIT 11-5569 TaxID=1548151 RepID=UPI00051FEAD3|nr:hypothetical protein [Helicobacter sp. MIT 11-5569]TLD84402.1 hypothetical protein LS70_002305 [Helicobacter sp. MIT 11-5569]
MKKINQNPQLAGKIHCCAPQNAEQQSRLISLDYNYTKKYNYNNECGIHFCSLKGINFNRRGFRPVADTLNAIIAYSKKSTKKSLQLFFH